MGDKRNSYNILVGKSEGKRPFGRHRRRWEDNIKIDPKETGWEVENWIYVAVGEDQWRAAVNMVMNLRVPQRRGISLLAK
jgi:hypothetical protein